MQLRQPLNLRKPLQMTAHKIRPTLNLPFAASGSLGPLITFTRASAANYFNSSGTLTAATTNVARFDYDPSTLIARGLLIEEARTNSIRNNTMVGASNPSTIPTNWIASTALTGLTLTISTPSTESGINYLEFRLNGTPSGAGSYQFFYDSTTQIVAANGDNWTSSVYLKLAAGSLTGVTSIFNQIQDRTVAGGFISGYNGSAITPTSAGLATQRNTNSVTLSGGGTVARVINNLTLNLSGAAIDITLRIGMPQLELGAFATSVISTSTVAVTRAADIASITGANFTSFWNATQGTIVANYLVNQTLTSNGYIAYATEAAATDYDLLFISTASGKAGSGNTFAASANQGRIDGAAAFAAGAPAKAAYAFNSSGRSISVNGGTVATSASAARPTGQNVLYIGSDNVGTNNLNGWISSLQIYPVGLTSTQIQTLST